jgi:hypothetical protein
MHARCNGVGDDMSDRVAIIGGSEVGRDHFPFPVKNRTALSLPANVFGTGAYYPLIFDEDTMCSHFYRVKKWHFSLQLSARLANGYIDPAHHENGFTFDSGAVYVDFDFELKIDDPTTNYVPTRESDLVISRDPGEDLYFEVLIGANDISSVTDDSDHFSISNVIVNNYVFDDGSGEALFGCVFNFGFNYGQAMVWNAGHTCLFSFAIGGDDGEDCGTYYLIPGFETMNVGDKGQAYLGTQPTLIRGAVQDEHHRRHLDTVDLQVFAAEYWPYAARDNSPIYNIYDGSQLQDPLSDYDVGDIEETITQRVGTGLGEPNTLVIHRNPSPWIAV